MRKQLIIAGCAALAACAATAGAGRSVAVAMSTNATVSAAFAQELRGAVDAVYIAASTNGYLHAAATGTVSVAYAPHHGLASVSILDAYDVTGSATLRPRVTGNATSGAALAGTFENVLPGEGSNVVSRVLIAIPYERINLAGETVTATVTHSEPNVTWQIVVVTE
jgi:hypothetical protein